jgi:hypothetical protein
MPPSKVERLRVLIISGRRLGYADASENICQIIIKNFGLASYEDQRKQETAEEEAKVAARMY